MSRNGSGIFIPPGTDFPAVASTLIESVKFNNVINDISTALTGSMAVNGEAVVTANIPMAGFKMTGIGAATVRTDAASLANIQDGAGIYVATVGGTADVITLTPLPAIAALVDGMRFIFKASGTNTVTNVTINISGLGAKSTTRLPSYGLSVGEIIANDMVSIIWDAGGNQFMVKIIPNNSLLMHLAGTETVTGSKTFSLATTFSANVSALSVNTQKTTVASAITPDIFAATVGQLVDYTGTATCTGFTAASTAGIFRTLYCAGACKFTSGANLIIEGFTSGNTVTMAAGAIVMVLAITTTQFKITYSASGTFTAGTTGLVGNPTPAAHYVVKNGLVYLRTESVAGTSNATTFTITGLPAVIQPIVGTASSNLIEAVNNSVAVYALPYISGSTITLYNGHTTVAWTASGGKHLNATATTADFIYSLSNVT